LETQVYEEEGENESGVTGGAEKLPPRSLLLGRARNTANCGVQPGTPIYALEVEGIIEVWQRKKVIGKTDLY